MLKEKRDGYPERSFNIPTEVDFELKADISSFERELTHPLQQCVPRM